MITFFFITTAVFKNSLSSETFHVHQQAHKLTRLIWPPGGLQIIYVNWLDIKH